MRKNKGFTLIELLITLAVAAIVMSVAIPSFTQMMLNNSSATVGTELSVALNYARSEAIKRAQRVSICASDNGIACLPANNWKEGWLVFVDDAATDTAAAATVGTVLRYWDELPEEIDVSALKGNANIPFLRFISTGAIARDVEGRRFIVFMDGCEGRAAANIVVGISGMISVQRMDCP